MSGALDILLEPPRQVVIAGSASDGRTRALRRAVYDRYIPALSIVPLDPGESEPRKLNRFLETMGMADGKPAAYVCRNFACELPVTEPEDLANLLDGGV